MAFTPSAYKTGVAFAEYRKCMQEVADLVRLGKEDTHEIEAVRTRMDRWWQKLSPDEVKLLSKIKA